MRVGTPAALIEALRECGTAGEPALKPYQSASISLERVSVDDLVPTAKYVLEEQVEYLGGLQVTLQKAALDIFDLTCGLVWPDPINGRAVAPPIAELWEDEGLLLVDGLHRVWLAKTSGVRTITCAVVRGASVPLVPLPTTWNNVKLFPPGERPTLHEKRDYRFPDSSSLRRATPAIAAQVTDENFRYFLFRDLKGLGSSGVRPTTAESEGR